MDNTPASKLIRGVFFAFAEFERDMIVERTSEGKAVAKQKPDYREGRKKKEINEKKYTALKERVDAGDMTVTEACKQLGIGRTKWYSMSA
jgi:DNA invertase Pin-like site-specific DNA recombinase